MQQDVLFRGTKDGLLIVLNEEPDFATLILRLSEKLATTGQFFRGAEVSVAVGRRNVTPAQRDQLARVLEEPYGLILRQVREGDLAEMMGRVPPARPAAAKVSAPEGTSPETANIFRVQPPLVVNRTLRSGQAIRHPGDVLIIGDVNPGAEVIATGHIAVMGSLRGVAHAGATGDETAFVLALRLQPSQLRIGRRVGRPPDGQAPPTVPEVARVVDGQIVIEGRST